MALTIYRIDREQADRLLFLFHGYSAEQHHLAAYVPLVDPDERFSAVCPRAIHDLEEGDGASWWHYGAGGADVDSMRTAIATADALVDGECAERGIDRARCVIGGFSQGGILALALAGRRGAPRCAGVWAMCCTLPPAEAVELDLAAGAGTPVLFQFGRRDPIISTERAAAVPEALRQAGWAVTDAGYDMDHSQRIEMMVDARAWLAAIS